MANEFDEYEESEAAEDTAWTPEHDFTIFTEEAESSDAIPFDEGLGAALDAEFETVLESQLEQDEDPTGLRGQRFSEGRSEKGAAHEHGGIRRHGSHLPYRPV